MQSGVGGTWGWTGGSGGGAGAGLMGEGTVPRQRFDSLSNWEKPRAPQVSNSPSFHPPTKDSVHRALGPGPSGGAPAFTLLLDPWLSVSCSGPEGSELFQASGCGCPADPPNFTSQCSRGRGAEGLGPKHRGRPPPAP